tara:strand:+ start:382 stop:1023 length:642 start_codon:yes stop_codon:yes gene_type:complete
MKDLTKEEIIQIVKEANRDILKEYFPSYADEAVTARKENLIRYQSFVSSAKNFLDQIIEKAKGDYESKIIDDTDIDYLINDHLNKAVKIVKYIKASLLALKGKEVLPVDLVDMSQTGEVDLVDMSQTGEQSLARYQSFILGAKNFFNQFLKEAKMDYQEGNLSDADIDYLINDQCDRARQAVEYIISSLIALKEQGIKPTETSPIYPTSRYEE